VILKLKNANLKMGGLVNVFKISLNLNRRISRYNTGSGARSIEQNPIEVFHDFGEFPPVIIGDDCVGDAES